MKYYFLGIFLALIQMVGVAPSAEASHWNVLRDGASMSVGSTGPYVVQLQGLLSELGFLNVPAGIPLGYFGPLTKSAVAQYQASLGVISTGYFGPLTRAGMTESLAVKGWLALINM